jgi:hypothetical protein
MKKRYLFLFLAVILIALILYKASAQTTPTNPGGVSICSIHYDCGQDDNVCPEDFGATCNFCDPDCSYTINGNTVTTASFCVGKTKGGTECNPYCQQIAPEVTALSIDTMIASTIPTRDQRDANLVGEITVYFKVLMDTSQELIQDSMAVLTASGQTVQTTKRWTSASPGPILTISTQTTLQPSTTYTVALDGLKFLTASGEAVQGTYTFSFTTRSAQQQQPSCVNVDGDGASASGGGNCCGSSRNLACSSTPDCNDNDAAMSPSNSEENACGDSKDNDCDNNIDCRDTDCLNPSINRFRIGPNNAQCCSQNNNCPLSYGCDATTSTCKDSVLLSGLSPQCCQSYQTCYETLSTRDASFGRDCPAPNDPSLSTLPLEEFRQRFRNCGCTPNGITYLPSCLPPT